MGSNSIVVNGQFFKTQKDLKTFIQSILKKYPAGDVLDRTDHCFCVDLLKRHPNCAEKIGGGIKSIRVDIHKPWTTKGFTIIRLDGTEADFSFNSCVSSKSMAQRQLINKAARNAVRQQIKDFKTQNTVGERLICAVTGELLKCSDCDIDHFPVAFADLLDQYLLFSGLDFEKVNIIADATTCRFADVRIERDFANWHMENASLRPVKSQVNQRLGRHSLVAS